MSTFLIFRSGKILLWGIFLLVAHSNTLRAIESVRFTDSLSVEQKSAIGLSQLTSDNVAVINALVRQDENAAEYRNNTIRSTRFSQRRTAHEKEISGLARLAPNQITELDDLVGRRFAPIPTLTATSSPMSGGGGAGVETVTNRQKPEIHGKFSLTYGRGKGGSVMGGDATLVYQDPEHRYSVLFNYSQYRGKGYLPGLYPCDAYYPNRIWADGSGLDHP